MKQSSIRSRKFSITNFFGKKWKSIKRWCILFENIQFFCFPKLSVKNNVDFAQTKDLILLFCFSEKKVFSLWKFPKIESWLYFHFKTFNFTIVSHRSSPHILFHMLWTSLWVTVKKGNCLSCEKLVWTSMEVTLWAKFP